MSRTFTEEDFGDAICKILDWHEVEYEREKKLKAYGTGKGSHGRRCDIFIPETDTAIELKLEASMRGVGQCAYYTRFCREAVLLVDGDTSDGDGHKPAVQAAAQVVPGVKYGLCAPGPHLSRPRMDIYSNNTSRFLERGYGGSIGKSREFIVLKTLGAPGEGEEFTRTHVTKGERTSEQIRGDWR